MEIDWRSTRGKAKNFIIMAKGGERGKAKERKKVGRKTHCIVRRKTWVNKEK